MENQSQTPQPNPDEDEDEDEGPLHTNHKLAINEAIYPWDQQEGESAIWHQRFQRYCFQGVRRSIRRTFREETGQVRSTPARWYVRADEWLWAERAKAWDIEQAEIQSEEYTKQRTAQRSMRRDVIDKFGELIQRQIPDLEGEDFTWRSATDAFKAYTESSRTEFDDLPIHRTENTITVRLIEELSIAFTMAFEEVNALPDPEQRRELFSKKILELSSQTVG